MKIRWAPEAAADFAGIVEYIHKENPSASDRVAHAIYDSATWLESLPNRGRPGRIDGTRELVLTPLPFILVYREKRDAVENCEGAARLTALAMKRIVARSLGVDLIGGYSGKTKGAVQGRGDDPSAKFGASD